MDGARGKEWLRARGHHLCLLQIQFSIFFFFFFLRNSRSAIIVLTSYLLLSSYFEIPRRCTVCNSVNMIKSTKRRLLRSKTGC